jgi:predicted glycosyltransferase
VACSLRDILVDARPDQAHHDERARWMTDRWFDAVLVHSDAGFARLQDSFHPRRPLRTPVFHTGYVVPARARDEPVARGEHLLVSAGGGIVGEDLFGAALTARERLSEPLPLRIVAGPFLPEPAWSALRSRCEGVAGVTLLRHVGDMVAEMRAARASLSQCGYNTALDLIVSGVPALVSPYETATENEQRGRAEKLAALGALQCLPPGALEPAALACAIEALLRFTPRPTALALDGALRSAEILISLLAERGRVQEAA